MCEIFISSIKLVEKCVEQWHSQRIPTKNKQEAIHKDIIINLVCYFKKTYFLYILDKC